MNNEGELGSYEYKIIKCVLDSKPSIEMNPYCPREWDSRNLLTSKSKGERWNFCLLRVKWFTRDGIGIFVELRTSYYDDIVNFCARHSNDAVR